MASDSGNATTPKTKLKDVSILVKYQRTMTSVEKLTLAQLEEQLAETELYLDRYAHEMNSSTAPGERDY